MNSQGNDLFSMAGRADQQPLHILVQILDFVPIVDVFRCLSISRAWQEAATIATRSRKTVAVDPKFRLKYMEDVSMLDSIETTIGMDMESLSRGLTRMVRLRRLFIGTDLLDRITIRNIIMLNASRLRVIDMAAYELSLSSCDPPGSFVLPLLEKLNCSYLAAGSGTNTGCPRLQHVSIQDQRNMRLILPPDSMLSLQLKYTQEIPNDTMIPFAIDPVCQLNRLTKLSLTIPIGSECSMSILQSKLCELFQQLSLLEDLKLDLGRMILLRNFSLDICIETLARRNAALQKLSLAGMKLTDASLVSLSHLTDLSFLELLGDHRDFSVHGILALLRGRSRRRLQDLVIMHLVTHRAVIREEIQAIERETGNQIEIQNNLNDPNWIQFNVIRS